MRSPRIVLVGLTALFTLSGCATTVAISPTSLSAPPVREAQVSATFTTEPGTAITYDPKLVPAGARGAVQARSGDGSTTFMLAVRDLQPNRVYGAHVHTNPCGASPDDAGPHFQREVDPAGPGVDPQHTNPENEIWLDFTTDATGAGSAETTVAWELPDDRRLPGSVVIHATGTNTGPGVAGTAGARVACVTIKFD